MQDASSKQQTKHKSSADRITTSLNLAHQRKNKQTKTHTNLTLYEAYTNGWTKLRRAETKRKKEFNLGAWEFETSYTINFKKMKRQRNITQMKEQTRNTEVYINEEEIGKFPEIS